MESRHEIDPRFHVCEHRANGTGHFARSGGWFYPHRRQRHGNARRFHGLEHQTAILGQSIFNDKDERVGSIDDIIVAPDKAVSYAVINAGGFTGLTKHDVAVPISQLKLVDNKLVLAGATKEALKASPAFEYAR
jgi:sporulation protein YlmC with PRC-barrel domain